MTKSKPLVAVHRGVGGGLITENTLAAGIAAKASGADIVEFDVVRSQDGDFFVFHDGYEFQRFGVTENMTEMTTREICGLRYRLHGDDRAPETVCTVAQMLEGMPEDTIFNVDRSWKYWNTLLPYLDHFDMADRLLFKCPPAAEWLENLAEHEVKYPLIPMVRSLADLEFCANFPGVNVVGFELLAECESHPFTHPEVIREIQEQGYLVFVNAINLESRVPLFAGWDDNSSILRDPAQGWGELLDREVDVIQTDWPALLTRYMGRATDFPAWSGKVG